MPSKYIIEINEYAQRQFRKLDKQTQKRLQEAIKSLAENPRPNGYIKMKGRPAYRIREGDYRIIYEVKDQILLVTVVEVGHRRDIYD